MAILLPFMAFSRTLWRAVASIHEVVPASGDYPQADGSATCWTDVISCGSHHIATSADVRVRRAFRTRPHGQGGKSAPRNTISPAKFPDVEPFPLGFAVQKHAPELCV